MFWAQEHFLSAKIFRNKEDVNTAHSFLIAKNWRILSVSLHWVHWLIKINLIPLFLFYFQYEELNISFNLNIKQLFTAKLIMHFYSNLNTLMQILNGFGIFLDGLFLRRFAYRGILLNWKLFFQSVDHNGYWHRPKSYVAVFCGEWIK